MSRLHRQTHNRTWARIRREVLDRDGWRCQTCGKPGRLEVHHVKPLQEGGTNDLGNLTTLCRGCHIAAHRRVLAPEVDAWRAFAGELLDAV